MTVNWSEILSDPVPRLTDTPVNHHASETQIEELVKERHSLPSTALSVYRTFSVKTVFFTEDLFMFADKIYFKVVPAGNYFDIYGDVMETNI